MTARGLLSLYTAHLPVPKTLASKPCVSITCKLIENNRLQLHCFGHLRKTGGGGVINGYRSCAFSLGAPITSKGVPVFLSDQFASFLSLLFPLHTKSLSVTLLFPLLTQKQWGIPPVENVGAPTFLIFPVIFRTFWSAAATLPLFRWLRRLK